MKDYKSSTVMSSNSRGLTRSERKYLSRWTDKKKRKINSIICRIYLALGLVGVIDCIVYNLFDTIVLMNIYIILLIVWSGVCLAGYLFILKHLIALKGDSIYAVDCRCLNARVKDKKGVNRLLHWCINNILGENSKRLKRKWGLKYLECAVCYNNGEGSKNTIKKLNIEIEDIFGAEELKTSNVKRLMTGREMLIVHLYDEHGVLYKILVDKSKVHNKMMNDRLEGIKE